MNFSGTSLCMWRRCRRLEIIDSNHSTDDNRAKAEGFLNGLKTDVLIVDVLRL